jgi:hypothetical protein
LLEKNDSIKLSSTFKRLSLGVTSEKSIPFFGNDTKPGSKYAARACEIIEREISVQIIKAFNVP